MIMQYFMEYLKLRLNDLTFATMSLTFSGHEAGLFHAFRVIIIYCDQERDVLHFLCWQLLLF